MGAAFVGEFLNMPLSRGGCDSISVFFRIQQSHAHAVAAVGSA